MSATNTEETEGFEVSVHAEKAHGKEVFVLRKIERIALIGLGAMGVFFAPRLYEIFGENFYVIAEGERKKRLEDKGVTINGCNYKFPIATPEEKGKPADLILIGGKRIQLRTGDERYRKSGWGKIRLFCPC